MYHRSLDLPREGGCRRQADPWYRGAIIWLPAELSEMEYAEEHSKAGDTIEAFPGSWVQAHWDQLMEIYGQSDDLPF